MISAQIMRNVLKIIFLILIPSCVLVAGSQDGTYTYFQEKNWEESKNSSWEKKFTGSFDDLYAIEMTIHSDNGQISGEYMYSQSGEVFQLEGYITDNSLLLEEISSEVGTCGYFRGILNNGIYSGTWTDHSETRSMNFHLDEISADHDQSWNCGENKWTNKFSGKINNETLNVLLSKDADNQLSGWVVMANIYYRLIGDCVAEYCSGAELILMANNIVVGNMRIKQTSSQMYEASINTPEIIDRSVVLILEQDYKMDCLTWSDFGLIADAVFIKTGERKFDEFLYNLVSEKFKASIQEYFTIKDELKEFSRNDRNRWSYHAWNDIHYISDRIISGIITMVGSTKPDATRIAYIFDVGKGRNLQLDDFVKDQVLIEKQLQKELESMTKVTEFETAFSEWVLKDSLTLVSLKPHGISFSTGFHPVFGEYTIVIPYGELNDQLKRNNLTKELTRS